MQSLSSSLNRFRFVGPIVLRVSLGIIFLWHGIDKFDAGISNVEGAFDSWGVPLPGLAAPFTAIVEIVAGVALIIGLGTRIAAALLGLIMIGAVIFVKAELGLISSEPMPGTELDLALLAGLVTLFVTGPGRFSADEMIGLEPSEMRADRELVGAAS
jgi:putative oxidoreductase